MVEETIPKDLLEENQILPRSEAFIKIHFPQSEDDINEAQKRLGLDEIVEIQKQAQEVLRKRKLLSAPKLEVSYSMDELKELFGHLPFELTATQETAIKEILDDLGQESPMYRLLNGDVGSGKTIVALAAGVGTYANDKTTVIMAPTTILAQQHYQTISKILDNTNLNIPVRLLTSDHKDLIDEAPQIIIGTHALLHKETLPENTALIIVDEQHRFGVAQRKLLFQKTTSKKAAKRQSPHYLTMTATPIPRTLTMALYGSTSVSILDELPPGRKPVETHLVPTNRRKDSYTWIEAKIKNGEQVFVICPLVEDSEKVAATAAIEEYDRLRNKVFPNNTVGLVHGQLKEAQKQATLDTFRKGKTDILVATAVIEVGIDIPNATIMVIEDAERFGLAQLHQFRGRIGRGDKQAYCFLFTESSSPDARDRLEYFSKHNSGFEVAEYDLKLRGPGEVYGLRQSGILNLRFANISDPKQFNLAEKIAIAQLDVKEKQKTKKRTATS